MQRYQIFGFGLWAVCLKDTGEMSGWRLERASEKGQNNCKDTEFISCKGDNSMSWGSISYWYFTFLDPDGKPIEITGGHKE